MGGELMFGGMLLFFLLIFGLVIGSTIFWIWMIIDCAQRKFKNSDERLIWILIIIFTGIIGALIYYFVIKKR